MKLSFVAAAMAACSTGTVAQEDLLPRVLVNPDSSFTFEGLEDNLSAMAVNASIDYLDVYTLLKDGTLVRGLMYEGETRSGSYSVVYPDKIIIDNSGEVVEILPAIFEVVDCQSQEAGFYSFVIHESVQAEVLTQKEYQKRLGDGIASVEDRIRSRGLTNIIIPYGQSEQVGEPGGGADRSSIYYAFVQGMKLPFDRLLLINGLQFQVEVEWKPTLGPGNQALAAAIVRKTPKTWPEVRNRLTALYVDADLDSWESNFQANFPPANAISYNKLDSSGAVVTVTNDNIIWLTDIQRLALFGDAIPVNPLFQINASQPWDYDPRDGIDNGSLPGSVASYDLASALAHEMGHHLGFGTQADNIHDPTRPPNYGLELLDVFRFNRAPSGLVSAVGVTPANMRNEVRELREGVSVATPTMINSPTDTHQRAPGPAALADQPSHWAAQPLVSGFTGMMIPSLPAGKTLFIDGTVIREPDARVIDLIGYDIDEPSFDYDVSIFLTPSPLTDPQVDPSQDLTLSWSVTPQPEAGDESSLFIYQINETTPQIPSTSLVYRIDGLTGLSHTISAGDISFVPGARYQWHVAAQIPLGLAVSDPATFTVQGSPPEPKPCGPLNESAKLLGPSGGFDNAELGYDVAIDGEWAAAGSPSYKEAVAVAGRVEIYKQDGSLWRHHQTVLSPNPQLRDSFGTAVDIDGNYMVVGAAYARDLNIGAGLAYVYELVNDEWVYVQTLEPDDAVSGETDHFGISAEISGTRIVIGAPWHKQNGPSYSGSAYVFELDQGVWGQTHQFFPSTNDFTGDEASGDYFGWSVSLDGNRIAIGAYRDEVEDGNTSGSATTYEHDGMAWVETGKVFRTPSADVRDNDSFGYSVSISGDALVVGAYEASDIQLGHNSGIVYAYDWDGMQWGAPQVLGHDESNGNFGHSVAVQGDILVVGAEAYDGQAFMFRRPNSVWEFAHELTRTDEGSTIMDGGRFGNAVDTDGGRAIGGATYASTVPGNSGASRGAAYIHEVRACLADLNDDGQLNFFDVSQFLTWNSEGDLRADWNCDGVLDFFDTSKFLEYYNGGCP